MPQEISTSDSWKVKLEHVPQETLPAPTPLPTRPLSTWLTPEVIEEVTNNRTHKTFLTYWVRRTQLLETTADNLLLFGRAHDYQADLVAGLWNRVRKAKSLPYPKLNRHALRESLVIPGEVGQAVGSLILAGVNSDVYGVTHQRLSDTRWGDLFYPGEFGLRSRISGDNMMPWVFRSPLVGSRHWSTITPGQTAGDILAALGVLARWTLGLPLNSYHDTDTLVHYLTLRYAVWPLVCAQSHVPLSLPPTNLKSCSQTLIDRRYPTRSRPPLASDASGS